MARISKRQQKEKKKDTQQMYSVGIYARLSVDNHNEKNESIETQIDIAKSYIKDKSEFELYNCYVDLGKSGMNFKREGFERLMTDIRQGEVNCVVVKDFSRFGRNYIETGNFIQKIFPFLGVRFISVTDRFDSIEIQKDDFNVNLKSLVNEMYARDIAAKVKSTRISQRKNGSYVGGYPPYGYCIDKTDKKRVLVLEENAAIIVKKIFYQYEMGDNCKQIIKWLYENKIHRPTEYRKYKHIYCQEGEELLEWSKWTVKAILTNPVYIGGLLQDKDNTHPSIIDKEQFFKIADKFEQQSFHYSKNKSSTPILLEDSLNDNIFEGILFCGDCNSMMKRRAFLKKMDNGNKIRIYAYDCPNATRIDLKRCENHNILLDRLQIIIKELLKKEWLLSGITQKDLIEYLEKQFELKQNILQKNGDYLEKKINACKIQQSEQYLKYRSNIITLQAFKKVQQENRQRLEILSEKFNEIKNKQKEYDNILTKKKTFLSSLLKFDMTSKLDKEFLHMLIKKIYIFSDKRIEITFCFQKNNFLQEERLSHQKW